MLNWHAPLPRIVPAELSRSFMRATGNSLAAGINFFAMPQHTESTVQESRMDHSPHIHPFSFCLWLKHFKIFYSCSELLKRVRRIVRRSCVLVKIGALYIFE